jgi:hypothetical protein
MRECRFAGLFSPEDDYKNVRGIRRARVPCGLIATFFGIGNSWAADLPPDLMGIDGSEVLLFGSVQRNFDSNLYRLPENPAAFGIYLPPGYSRTDQFTESGAGIDANLWPARQAVSLHLTADQVSFDRNSYLDYTAGDGLLTWDWVSGNTLSGSVSAAYTRTLADFVNNRVFAKDVIDHSVYLANLRWAVTADFAVRLRGDAAAVTQNAAIKKYEDNRGESGTITFEYARSDTLTAGLNYQETHSRFNDPIYTFTDKSTFASFSYVVSAMTTLNADAGLYRRRYSNAADGDFSGVVWHVSGLWQATPITSLTLKTWRELNAYLNEQTDYYVTNAESAAVNWSPDSTVVIALNQTLERQDYRGIGLGVLSTMRQDHVATETVSLKWNPRPWAELTLAAGAERRSSTEGYFNYRDRVERVKFRLIW